MSDRLKYASKRIKVHLNIKRIRRRRGHGVHSPFVYALTQNVFKKPFKQADKDIIYNNIVALGIKRQTAEELQKVYDHCGFEQFFMTCDTSERSGYPNNSMLIATEPEYTSLSHVYKLDHGENRLLVIIEPYRNDEILKFCRKLIDSNVCVSIDRFYYILFFFNIKLTPQHFEL